VAFDKGGLRVAFAFEKPAPENPGLTTIVATYTNSGLEDIEGFTLQVGAWVGFWGKGVGLHTARDVDAWRRACGAGVAGRAMEDAIQGCCARASVFVGARCT
jgi:hypothetical protein